MVMMAWASIPYFSLISANALIFPPGPFSMRFKETISPTISTLAWALIMGYVSSMDLPEVVTSSIIMTLSPSFRPLPSRIPASP